MWFKLFILTTLTIAATLAEAPISKSAPYPAAGWRPQKPFNLPGEYVPPPPREVEQQQQQSDRGDIEISKERVDFAGQLQGNSLVDHTNEPVNAYLPPDQAETDFLSVQRLPNDQQPQFGRRPKPQPKRRKQQQQQFFPRPQPPTQTNNQQHQPQQQFNQQQKPQPQFGQQPQQQFDRQPQKFFPEDQQQQQFPRPAQQYGEPENGNVNIVYPDPRNYQLDQNQDQGNDASQDEEDNRTAIEALNAAVEAYNRRAQANRNTAAVVKDDGVATAIDAADFEPQSNAGYPTVDEEASAPTRFTQGQYYVLGPDNTLQRVMFTTSQDEQETRTNGFTAQLKYTPVGEVRDPVFKYNNRGQLVRIFKK